MVSSRQGKSISKAVDSRSLCGCLDLGGSRDQLHLIISQDVEVTQSALQKCLWPKAGEDWGSGSPPLGSSFSPPPPAGSLSSPVGTLSPPVNGPTHTLWTRPCPMLWHCHQGPNPCLDHWVSIYSVLPLTNPFQLHNFLSRANMAPFPPTSQLGFLSTKC